MAEGHEEVRCRERVSFFLVVQPPPQIFFLIFKVKTVHSGALMQRFKTFSDDTVILLSYTDLAERANINTSFS